MAFFACESEKKKNLGEIDSVYIIIIAKSVDKYVSCYKIDIYYLILIGEKPI